MNTGVFLRLLAASIVAVLVVPHATGQNSARSAVDELHRLGRVSIVYEPARDETRKGQTNFKFNWNYTFEYQYQSRTVNGSSYITVEAVVSMSPTVSHTIFMPNADRNADWSRRLLLHEYDHVAISLDERPIVLLRCMTQRLRFVDVPVTGVKAETDRRIRRLITREVDAYGASIAEVIRKNYELLDAVTSHGHDLIGDRQRFFDNMYSYENLRQCGFRYLDAVSDCLVSREYQQARAYYF